LLELLNLDKLLFFPDIYFPWVRKAVNKSLVTLKDKKIDAIIATVPPYSSFIVGYKLSKKLNIPLILDYRDPWSGNPFLNYPPIIRNKVKRVEKRIVNHSKLLVTVGNDYANLIADSLNINSDKFEIIYNGFSLDKIPEVFPNKEKDKFVISYFGNFYLIQKPEMQKFFDGLGLFIRKNNLNPSKIVFQYSGHTSRKVIRRMLKKAGIESFFIDLKYRPRDELFDAISKSHLVIDIVPKKTEYMIHTKIYDYALGNSHIFLVGERGAIVDVCNKIKQKFTIVKSDKEAVAQKLALLWEKWKKGKLEYGCNKERLLFYSRENQANRLADILLNEFSNDKS